MINIQELLDAWKDANDALCGSELSLIELEKGVDSAKGREAYNTYRFHTYWQHHLAANAAFAKLIEGLIASI